MFTLSVSTLGSVINLLEGKKIAILSGAGVSTDSGIPDYRGAGAPRRSPMTFQQYMESESHRKRYWAGSHLGWKKFASASPNAGHTALAALERSGIATGVLTQNVDSLHRQAGSQRVVELHGAMHSVQCLRCGQHFSRENIAARLSTANPWLDLPEDVVLQPDGDVEVDRLADFEIPNCENCSGLLKPDVVFFGELIPKARFQAAASVVRTSEALLIVGSSLVVNSGIRLLDLAQRNGIPVAIVNRGPTKGDRRATVRLEAGTTETLTALAEALTSE